MNEMFLDAERKYPVMLIRKGHNTGINNTLMLPMMEMKTVHLEAGENIPIGWKWRDLNSPRLAKLFPEASRNTL